MKEINVDSHNVPATARSKNYQTALTTTAASGGGATTPSVVTPTGGAADTAKVAQNLAEDSTDWAKILRKDIDERTENALSIGKNLTVDGQAILNDVVANTGTFSGMLKAAAATITGALLASTVSATTMKANTFIGDLVGNAASATKLQTTHKIFGNDFNGLNDVSGTVYANIGLRSRNICVETESDGSAGTRSSEINNFASGLFLQYATSNNLLCCQGGGLVGINTTTPQYKLDVNGNMRVTSDIYAYATVGTNNFVSHTTGWNVSANGAADFRNIYADELRVQAFTADISQALAGSDYLTKSVSKLSANFVVPSVNSTVRIIVDDIEGMPATQCFSNGDYIRFRAFNRTSGLTIANVWGTVTLDTTYGTNGFLNGTQAYTFTCTQTTGAGLTVFKGSEVLDYGTSGSGLIARTTLDTMGSPYEQIATWKTDPSNGNNYTVHARLGNLGGIANCSGYGLFTDNGFFTGKITVGDLTKTNHYLDFSNGALTVKGNIYLSSGYAAVSTLDMSHGISLAVDNIQIGGRNLIAGSSLSEYTSSYPTSGYIDNQVYLSTEILKGTQYVMSFWAKSTVENDKITSYFYHPDTTIYGLSSQGATSYDALGYMEITLSTTWKYYWISYTTNGTDSSLKNCIFMRLFSGYGSGTVSMKGCKLESGTKATDWTPAPEDVDAAINLKVSKDGVIGAINLTSEAATINASKINLVGAVTANSIVSGAVTTDKLAAKAATIDKIDTASLTAAQAFIDDFNANIVTTKKLNVAKIVADGIAAQTIDAQSATISNLNVVNATVSGYFHAEYSAGAFVRMGQPTSSKILDIRADNLTGMYIGVYGDNSTGLSITANGASNGALDIHGSSYLITRQASTSEGTWINGLSLCRVTITSGGDLGFGSLGWYQNGGYYMPNLIVSKASSNISVYIPSDMADGAVLIFRNAGDGTINIYSHNFSDQFHWNYQYQPYAPVKTGALCIMVYDKASHTWYPHSIF